MRLDLKKIKKKEKRGGTGFPSSNPTCAMWGLAGYRQIQKILEKLINTASSIITTPLTCATTGWADFINWELVNTKFVSDSCLC